MPGLWRYGEPLGPIPTPGQAFGRKRHLLVDTPGLVMVVLITTAAVQDRDGVRLLLQRPGGACKKLRLI